MALVLPIALLWSGLTAVHIGDSHVSGGLVLGLRDRFESAGARYYSSYWVSSSTVRWAFSDRLPEILRRRQPDVVIVTLGSNEALYPNTTKYAEYVRKLVRRIGDRQCFWIGPPTYRRFSVDRIVGLQQANVTPCRFFDSRGIDAERSRTQLHFTRAGGEVWADAIWQWMNSDPQQQPAPAVSPVSAASPPARRFSE